MWVGVWVGVGISPLYTHSHQVLHQSVSTVSRRPPHPSSCFTLGVVVVGCPFYFIFFYPKNYSCYYLAEVCDLVTRDPKLTAMGGSVDVVFTFLCSSSVVSLAGLGAVSASQQEGSRGTALLPSWRRRRRLADLPSSPSPPGCPGRFRRETLECGRAPAGKALFCKKIFENKSV